MDILQYIVQEGYVMIAALWVIGKVITGTEVLKNKHIPIILLLVSVGFTPLLLGGYTPEAVVQSVLITGVTVYGDQVIKQLKKGE